MKVNEFVELVKAGRAPVNIDIDEIDFEEVKKFYDSIDLLRYFPLFTTYGPDLACKAAHVQIAHKFVEDNYKILFTTELANKISQLMIDLYPQSFKKVELEYQKWILKQSNR